MNRFRKHFSIFFTIFIVSVCRFIKLPAFLGVAAAQFSTMIFIPPLLATLLPLSFGYAGVGLFLVLKYFGLPSMVTFGLPTFAATLVWQLADENVSNLHYFALLVLVPVVCTTLFLLHPIGCQAGSYTVYWLIPVSVFIAHFFKRRSLVALSMASAFISHAVGSVIWLYSLPTTPFYWHTLVPVVAYERMLVAAGMLFVYVASVYVSGQAEKLRSQNVKSVDGKSLDC